MSRSISSTTGKESANKSAFDVPEFADMESSLKLEELPLVAVSDALQDRMQQLFRGAISTAEISANDSQTDSRGSVQERVASLPSWPARPFADSHLDGWFRWQVLAAAAACLLVGFIIGLSTRYRIKGSNSASTMAARSDQFNDGVYSGAPSNYSPSALAKSSAHGFLLLELAASDSSAGQTTWERTRWWEGQTSEPFPLKSHVSDARFEFCRLCHLAASNVATNATVP